jgi:hypothetical protein
MPFHLSLGSKNGRGYGSGLGFVCGLVRVDLFDLGKCGVGGSASGQMSQVH